MALHQTAQETGLPARFAEFLSGTGERLARPPRRPVRLKGGVAGFEQDILGVEQLAAAIERFVEFMRQAGQDDGKAREFDEWTGDRDLAEVIATFEQQIVHNTGELAATLLRQVESWGELADSGIIEPVLPPQLVERVTQLDARVKALADELCMQQKNELVARLLIRVAGLRPLTNSEALRMYDAAGVAVPAPGYPSVHRSDWYDDDGR